MLLHRLMASERSDTVHRPCSRVLPACPRSKDPLWASCCSSMLHNIILLGPARVLPSRHCCACLSALPKACS